MHIPDRYTHVSGFNSQPDLGLQPRIGEVAIFMLLHWSLKKEIFEKLNVHTNIEIYAYKMLLMFMHHLRDKNSHMQ